MKYKVGRGHTTDLAVIAERSISPETRIGQHITPMPNGCWEWNGGKRHGYGASQDFGGKWINVHRFVYETLVGPIDPDHEIHHECENRACCNPAHLTPLTRAEHRARHR